MDLQLRRLRRASGISQQKMADYLGVNIVSIGNWERGITKISLDYALKIAELLHVSVYELAGFESDVKAPVKSHNDGEDLSTDEERLIHDFRMLSIERKAALITIIGDVIQSQLVQNERNMKDVTSSAFLDRVDF